MAKAEKHFQHDRNCATYVGPTPKDGRGYSTGAARCNCGIPKPPKKDEAKRKRETAGE